MGEAATDTHCFGLETLNKDTIKEGDEGLDRLESSLGSLQFITDVIAFASTDVTSACKATHHYEQV